MKNTNTLYNTFVSKYFNNTLICIFSIFCVFFAYIYSSKSEEVMEVWFRQKIISNNSNSQDKKGSKDYIKWMEFNVPEEVLEQALSYDIKAHNQDYSIDWIELISYGAAKNWGKFQKSKKCDAIDDVVLRLQKGEKMQDITKDLKMYSFYYETYSSVLNGFVGEYEIEQKDPNDPEKTVFVKKYGLKAFSPVAKGYGFSHYDDFGVSRSYGYKRKHQGNDLMGNVGTPIIAIEDGYIEALGWNQYGGWRIGIRSLDKKRYYYYAHLRKDHPFVKTLKEGDFVQSGDVIGYLGMTGYSSKENVNNIKIPHLHFGLQIIFNETQKDGTNQIWIDVYNLIEFLNKNRMPVYKNTETKDFIRSLNINNIPID